MTQTAHRLRWSSARDCPRKAIYEATAAPHRERTHREERILWRGRAVGHEYLLAIATETRRRIHVCSGVDFTLPHPDVRAGSEEDADILAEVPVQWALGVGHADAFVLDPDTVIEVVSSQNPSGELIHSKLLQAAGYARSLDAEAVCVAIVDPATLEDDRVIVTRQNEKRWAELMGEVDARVEELVSWRDSGEMPRRVCRKPSESWGHFCLFAGHCFDDAPPWQPDFAGELQSDEAQRLAMELAHVKTRRREASAADRQLETEQKRLQQELERLVPAGAWQVGGYLVKRQERRGRRSFDFARAELDGRFPDGLLEEFTKTGEPFEVWDVEKTGDAVAFADEEVPF